MWPRGTLSLSTVILLDLVLPATGSGPGQDHPPLPPPSPIPATTTPDPVPHREEALERRVRQLEQMVDQLSRQLQEVRSASEAGEVARPGATGDGSGSTAGRIRQPRGQLLGDRTPSDTGVPTGPSRDRPPAVRATPGQPSRVRMPPPPIDLLPLEAKFGPGFQLADPEEEFVIRFHNLTQVDGRFYQQGDKDVAEDTFGLPRQWFVFEGRLTRPFEYYVAINQGFDNVALLDAFLNVRFDDRFQFKAGRFKTPFLYEFYGYPVFGLINPEWSQFFNNFGLNRDVGLMAWGQLDGGRVDYAVGIFNGTRNGFLDLDGDGKSVAALLDFEPFLRSGPDALRNFHLGGSLASGNQDEPQIPDRLRLNVPQQGNPIIGQPFLQYEPGVFESGVRALWSLHAHWFYRRLSLLGEWQSGYTSLAFRETRFQRTRVPVGSFFVQAGYFLTGEHVTTRNLVAPLRPFDLRKGRWGPGALELAWRYNLLDIGDQVFTGGFADPDLWTDRVQTIDLGVNWYWNRSIKVYLGWQKALFGSPVLFATAPERLQIDSDLWWLRFQVYF